VHFLHRDDARRAARAVGDVAGEVLIGASVNESLENLNAAQLKNLVRRGILARVYVHLLSLEHFGDLLNLRAARGQAA